MPGLIDIDDLATPLTAVEIQSSIYEVIAAAGTDHTAWKPGTIMRTVIAGVSVVGAAMSTLSSRIARTVSLDRCEGDWLTLVAYFRYGVLRIDETRASGSLTLTNPGGGSFNELAGAVTFLDPTTGKSFRNTSAFSLGPASSVTITIEAIEAGSASTAIAGAVTNIVTPLMTGVTCTNPGVLVGVDRESDPQLRVRCRERLGALSPNGPWDAYSYAAKSAVRSDGQPVAVTKVKLIPDGIGGIDAYLATDSGGATGTVGDLATDLGAADEAMQVQSVTQAVTLRTHASGSFPFSVAYTVYAYDSLTLTDAQLAARVDAALIAYWKALPIGGDRKPGEGTGYVRVSRIEGAVHAVDPVNIYDVVIANTTSETAVAIGATQVPTLQSTICLAVVRSPKEFVQ